MEFLLFTFDNNEVEKVYIDDKYFNEVRNLIKFCLNNGCIRVQYGITRSNSGEDIVLRDVDLGDYLLSPGLRDMVIP